mgnify:CR=1 FL=1
MYAYIDSFRKFGKTNTDNQSIKIKRPYPQRVCLFRVCAAVSETDAVVFEMTVQDRDDDCFFAFNDNRL